ncbi:MAG TPA: DUF3455 domain-containing protein [Vicinamibacterales bacterium]|nr:DUF3455 domain-containing protein [Vicinamibacterales bacterium]
MVRTRWAVSLGVVGLTLPILARLGGADIHPEFPVNERNISPPSVGRPIHNCARAVHVSGFIGKALIRVFADGVEVGKQNSTALSELDLPLTRALKLGEHITATQTVASVESVPSDPVLVEDCPVVLSTPVVTNEVYACGRIARVDNVDASTHVEVFDVSAASAVIGTAESTGEVAPVFVPSLLRDHFLRARQIACPDDAAKRVSPNSAQVKVKPNPPQMPVPSIEPGFVSGSEVLIAHGLLPGAEIEFRAGSDVVSSGRFADYPDNWFPLDKPISTGKPVTARQKLCTWSDFSAPVMPSNRLDPPSLGTGICEGARVVAVYNTAPGANVMLFRRPAGGGSAIQIGYQGAMPGTLDLHLADGLSLNRGDVVFARQSIGTTLSGPSNEVKVGCGGDFNVLTQHNDNFRTGAYLNERTLTPDAVLRSGMDPKFVELGNWDNVITQPLYVREVPFESGGANIVYVGTTLNRVYAINASTMAVLKSVELKDGIRPTPRGIETTPVIDLATNLIYVLFGAATVFNDSHDPGIPDFKFPGMDKSYWLVALDIRTLNEVGRTQVSGWVYTTQGKHRTFLPNMQVGHPALLLDHGSIYVAFGSDAGAEADNAYLDYHGWVFQYRASDLARQAVFSTTPNPLHRPNKFDPQLKMQAWGGGVWEGGGGLAADPDGNVFFLTGNGRSEPENGNYADAVIKLMPSGGSLVPQTFTPGPPIDPDPDQLEQFDADLGSGGALVVPGTPFVIGGGKSGWMYLLNRGTMALQQRLTAATNLCTPDARWQGWKEGPHLHGSPTLWRTDAHMYLYTWAEKDKLRQFVWVPIAGRFAEPEIHSGAVRALELPMPGGMASLSATGGDERSGVLWATLPQTNQLGGIVQARLYAFNASNLNPLWDGDIGLSPHWSPPTIADGAVFVSAPRLGDDGKTVVGRMAAFRLGAASRTSWTPTQPGPLCPAPPSPTCLRCHSATQLDALRRQWPLSRKFENEALLTILPERARRFSSPPDGVRFSFELEGNGTRIWRAKQTGGKLVWNLEGTTATLVRAEDGEASPPDHREPAVRLDRGWVWTAGDGSRVSTVVAKTATAPWQRDIPWTLFRVTRLAETGMLAGVQFVQMIETHAGRPDKAPAHDGETVSVPFYAKYRVFR